jgi:hypothetical protein
MQGILRELKAESLDHYIDEFKSNCPDRPSMRQVCHLTALAWTADVTTLSEYEGIFRKGKRLNFVPMITKEMIDRALQVAWRRSA